MYIYKLPYIAIYYFYIHVFILKYAHMCISLSCMTVGSRSIAFNGQFVFLVSSSLSHLLKIGTGKRGTIRGFVYASREIGSCWITLVDQQLLMFQKQEEGEKETIGCNLIDTDTLQVSLLPQI